tara:strand:- start:1075 stop:1593 length:519 start_codon:yes stop_codon:yes gene_type:complete
MFCKIVLIGFSGTGKSHFANIISKKYNFKLIDTDKLISDKYNKKLIDIINEFGEIVFFEIEKKVLISLKTQIINDIDTVFDIGGSLCYYDDFIKLLKQNNFKFIFLQTSFNNIKKRINGDWGARGIVSNNVSILKLYNDRLKLYEKIYDKKIICDNKNENDILFEIISFLNL